MLYRLIPLLFLLVGCSWSSFAYRSPGPYTGGALLGSGSYFAEIWLEPAGMQPQRFNALFSRKPLSAVFHAVAPSGKPLFQAREPTTPGEPMVFETYPTELPLAKAQLEAFYRALRPLILLSDQPGGSASSVTERYPDKRPRLLREEDGLSLRVDEYDWNGHAFRVEVTGPGWSARVALRQYDVGPSSPW